MSLTASATRSSSQSVATCAGRMSDRTQHAEAMPAIRISTVRVTLFGQFGQHASRPICRTSAAVWTGEFTMRPPSSRLHSCAARAARAHILAREIQHRTGRRRRFLRDGRRHVGPLSASWTQRARNRKCAGLRRERLHTEDSVKYQRFDKQRHLCIGLFVKQIKSTLRGITCNRLKFNRAPKLFTRQWLASTLAVSKMSKRNGGADAKGAGGVKTSGPFFI